MKYRNDYAEIKERKDYSKKKTLARKTRRQEKHVYYTMEVKR